MGESKGFEEIIHKAGAAVRPAPAFCHKGGNRMTTYKEIKQKVLSLIEEYNPNSEYLTDDPDIAAKFYTVTNQVMYELARMKKIPRYVEMDVVAGELVDFAAIEKECGYEIYQISMVAGVNYIPKASGTVLKILENGTAEIDVFVYPEQITAKTKDNYEFELSPDALEIMPYGIAADLLKSDKPAEYGSIYAARYKELLQMLDPRYQMTSIYIEGGVNI